MIGSHDPVVSFYYYSSIATAAVEGLISSIEMLPKFLTPYLNNIIIKVVVIVTS